MAACSTVYIYAKSKSELGVDVSGWEADLWHWSYDVYLYIDAETATRRATGGYRLVSCQGQ